MRISRLPRAPVLLATLAVAARTPLLRAQLVVEPRDATFWLGAAALGVGTAAFDGDISTAAARNQHTSLDRFAGTLQPLGLERYDIPVLAGTWVVARALGRRSGEAALRLAAGYVAADLMESVLKFAVGRHRPDRTAGGPWRFRPFSTHNEWQSFPSGHTTHVFAIAAGIAQEVHSPVVAVAAYGAAVLVGWQRIESRAHWPSDVVASAALAIAASRTTNRWLRGGRSQEAPGSRRVRVLVAPPAVMLSVAVP
jgi:membrane-associated phospholipid phosphatase